MKLQTAWSRIAVPAGFNFITKFSEKLPKIKEALLADRYSSKKHTFDQAYKDARSKGQKTFFWDGKYYNTDYEGSHGKQYRTDVASGKAQAWEQQYPGFTNPELRKEKQEELDTYRITNEQTKNKTWKDKTLRKIPARGYDVNDAISAIKGEHNTFSQYDSVDELISALRKKYKKLKDIPLTGGYIDTVNGGKAIYLDDISKQKKLEGIDDDEWQAFINDVHNYNRFNVLAGNPSEIHRPEYDYLLGYPTSVNKLVSGVDRALSNTPMISKYRTGSDPYYYTTPLLEASVPFYPEKFASRKKEGDPFEWESDEQLEKFERTFDEFTERYYNDPEYAKRWSDIGVNMWGGGLDISFPMLAKSNATPSQLDTLAAMKAFDYVEPLKLSPGNHLAGSGNESYYRHDDNYDFYKGKYSKWIDKINPSKEDHNRYNKSNIDTHDWIFSEPSLGTYTLSVPNDMSFVSVWDKFDVDPFGSGNDKPIIKVGKPFEYYTRFYPEGKEPNIDDLYLNFTKKK